MSPARSRPVLLGKLVLDRARLELGGLRYVPRAATEIPEQELLRVDVCESVASGMSLMSTQIMSMDTRPTVRVRFPLTSTGVPLGAWRG